MSRYAMMMVAGVALAAGLCGAARAICLDDCDGNGLVAVNELITCVGVGLGQVPLAQCGACDGDGDGTVGISELIAGVARALGSEVCPDIGTPTLPPSPTPTSTPGAADELTHCCVAAYYTWACEVHTVAECEQLKGVDKGNAEECSPALCGSIPPDTGHGICCLPNANGDEVECEDRAATACVAAGGVVKASGTVCSPATCADVAPPTIRCCVARRSGTEIQCEDRIAADCAARGGVDRGPGSCSPDVCR